MADFFRSAFLSPQFFWFLALVPIIVLLYLLKLRRTEAVIPSTMLWLKSLQDLTANAPFQRLRRNLLLLLQILAVILIVLALARPFVQAETIRGTQLALLIDRSASMQSVEPAGTRLDQAKQRALQMINDLKGGDKVMIIAFAETAEVLCELTDDRYRLRAAVNAIQPSDMRSNLRDVMQIVRGLTPDNPDLGTGLPSESVDAPAEEPGLELVLLSDGNLTDLGAVGARASNLTFLRIGEPVENAGIVGFSLRRSLEGDGPHQTFVRLHNANDEPLTTTVSLYFDDTALAVDETTVPANGNKDVVFEHPDLGTGILRAELDTEDALAVDNVAWLAIQPELKVRALVVSATESTSGYYLKRALSLEPRVELSAVEPANYKPTDEYDLVIFDGYAPDSLPPGTLVFVDAFPPIDGLVAGGETENPTVVGIERGHPTMRFLRLENVGILQARRLTLPEGGRTLVSSTEGPLIADVSRDGRRMLVLAFDIGESNWPLNLSFPLFLQNIVSWTPRSELTDTRSMRTGTPLSILPAPDVESATVITPSGARQNIAMDPMRSVYFGATDRVGVYRVVRGSETDLFAVNLLDANESAIAPAETIRFGRGSIQPAATQVVQTQELWRWFVVAALAILCLEWWIYSRRAWV